MASPAIVRETAAMRLARSRLREMKVLKEKIVLSSWRDGIVIEVKSCRLLTAGVDPAIGFGQQLQRITDQDRVLVVEVRKLG